MRVDAGPIAWPPLHRFPFNRAGKSVLVAVDLHSFADDNFHLAQLFVGKGLKMNDSPVVSFFRQGIWLHVVGARKR